MQGPIGFIGLGIMGRPMAKNLLKAGHALVVHNRSQAAVHEIAGLGAKTADSPAAVARAAGDVIIAMLPNSPDVEAVALGPKGLLEGVREGQILVDMSTISPIVSQKVGAALARKGVKMLDAPVSGGEKGAIEGILSIMVGGEAGVFQQVLPVFQAMGKTITHLGPLGAGGFTKLANQIIVAVNLTALAEALTLAAKAGLDVELTLKALGGGLPGASTRRRRTTWHTSSSPGSRSISTTRTSASSPTPRAPSGCRCPLPPWCRSCSARPA
jgi:2-hydroxy-3-oxopropionate reductase